MQLARSLISAHGSIGGNSVWHKDSGIEAEVNGSVSEEGDLPALHNIPNSDIEEDDPWV